MENMAEKLQEVASVLMNINVPVGLTDQVARPIKMCADRLIALCKPEPADAPEAGADAGPAEDREALEG